MAATATHTCTYCTHNTSSHYSLRLPSFFPYSILSLWFTLFALACLPCCCSCLTSTFLNASFHPYTSSLLPSSLIPLLPWSMHTTPTNLPLPSYLPTCTYPSLTPVFTVYKCRKEDWNMAGRLIWMFQVHWPPQHIHCMHWSLILQNVFSLSFQLIITHAHLWFPLQWQYGCVWCSVGPWWFGVCCDCEGQTEVGALRFNVGATYVHTHQCMRTITT